jgi:3-oxoisoapionate decarboxylase
LNRRKFLLSSLGTVAASDLLAFEQGGRLPIGLNTYCLRAMRWPDAQLIEYTSSQKLDAIFLQDSLDPESANPAHWREVGQRAKDAGLRIETGIGAILPKTSADFEPIAATLRRGIEMATAMGSPLCRCVLAADREHLPPGPVEQHIETAARVLKAVKPQAIDAGVKIAIENHKDLQAWEMRELIETAGKEFTGSLLDTGNPVFVMEDPMTTLDVLGPYALTVHLRDSAVYEHPRGAAVQWVPLGEGAVNFKNFVARMREVCPPVYVYIKPITGRPPAVIPYLEPAFWERYPKARAADFARFVALVKQGRPYENHMVIEDLPGRKTPEAFVPAIQYQQRDHMERSLEYAKKTLDLGVRWRA